MIHLVVMKNKIPQKVLAMFLMKSKAEWLWREILTLQKDNYNLNLVSCGSKHRKVKK